MTQMTGSPFPKVPQAQVVAVPASPERLTILSAADPAAPWPAPGKYFEALLGLVLDTVVRVDAAGTVLDYRPAQESDLTVSVDKVRGHPLQDILPPRLAAEASELIRTALSTGRVQTMTTEIPLNSLVRELQVRVMPVGQDEVIAVIRDVTDRQRLEQEILEISHREQQRIGQDLHDSLGQHLTGISFLSKALQGKLTSRGVPEAAQAGEIAVLVVETLAHTRNIARGLFPVELETSGRLIPALDELVANTEKLFRITCRLECEPGLEIHDARISTELFRITQEAISNAIKHGRAKRVSVRVHRTGAGARLVIQDDGSGIPADHKSNGLGLRIMNFRASRISGHLEVSAMEIGGSAVVCDFPLGTSATDGVATDQ